MMPLRTMIYKGIMNTVTSIERFGYLSDLRKWITTRLTSEFELHIMLADQRSASLGLTEVPVVRNFTRGEPIVHRHSRGAYGFARGEPERGWFSRKLEPTQINNPWEDWVLAFGFTYAIEQHTVGLLAGRTIWIYDVTTECHSMDRRKIMEPRLVHCKGHWGVVRGWAPDGKGISAMWFRHFVDAATVFIHTIKTRHGGMVTDSVTGRKFDVSKDRLWGKRRR